jgi:ABC-type bacteriocin/lantibiotic exporter with double-glycine peptidase domain
MAPWRSQILIVMACYSRTLTLIVLGAAAVYGMLRLASYRPLRQASEEHIVALAKQQSNFLETVRGVQSVKLFNRQQQRAAGLSEPAGRSSSTPACACNACRCSIGRSTAHCSAPRT